MFAPRIKATQAKPGSQTPLTHAPKPPQRTPFFPPGASLGNQAILQWRQLEALQTQEADPLEQEADRISEQVLRGSSDGETLRMELGGTRAVSGPAGANAQVSTGGSGRPLDAATRAYFEPRLGRDFSDVRLHADEAAARAALSLGAAAYTVGHHIVFGAGRYAPATSAGQRLIAHELAHVAQQRHTGPMVQRQPLPQQEREVFKAADQVTELTLEHRPDEGDVWVLAVKGDYTTPEAVGRLIWPGRTTPPSIVSIKRVFRMEVTVTKPAAAFGQETVFELSGLALFTVRSMDPSIAQLFRDRGLLEESEALRAARDTFHKRHADLDALVLDNIDRALNRVTRSNPELLEAYYRRYADWPLGTLESTSTAGETESGVDVWGRKSNINIGILHLRKLEKLKTDDPLSLLGSTLIHEFAHTSHAGDSLKGPGEGKAYGIENFFNERMGDKLRDDATMDLGPRMGDKTAFDTAGLVMKFLYQVIDGQTSRLPSLAGMSRQRARELVTEFISKNKDAFSPELKAFIRTEFGAAAYNSLR